MKACRAIVLFVLIILLASLVSVPRSFAAPDELLVNGGFEDGATGWSKYGGILSTTASPVCSGIYAVAFESDTASTKWIYQAVAVSPGETYAFAGYAIKNDPNIEKIFLRISWYESEDGFGSEISRNDSLTTLTDDQPQCRLLTTGEVTAPVNAHSARVKAILDPVSDSIATAYFDDLSFSGPPPATPTPTPTPMLTPTPSPTPMPVSEGDVVINEVQYNPPQSGPDAAFEWVEVFNRTTGTIHLDGWRIRDNQGSDLVPPLTLPPNGFAIIAATDKFYENFPDFAGTIVLLDSSIGNGLSNDGDRLILEDGTGEVIDALSYGDDTFISPPCPGVAEGHSLERSPPGGDCVDNSIPTPGFGFSPWPTPLPTPTPTISPTPTLTVLPPSPEGTPQPPAETLPSPGIGLRALLIILAIAFFGIVLLLRRWRRG